MIEVVALAGAINSISGAITSSIQAGRNLSQIAPQIAKLAIAQTIVTNNYSKSLEKIKINLKKQG